MADEDRLSVSYVDEPEGTEMEGLVRQYRAQIQQRELVADIAIELQGIRNITLPLDLLAHIYLEMLAEKLGESKSVVAVEILTRSLRDVYKAIHGQTLSEAEIREYYRANEHRLKEAFKYEGKGKPVLAGTKPEPPDSIRHKKEPTV
jgi:hypothetical protein